jgi:sugar-specific transcriptional regulator TrmB
MSHAYTLLREKFGVSDRELLIIQALEHNELTAEDICKQTHIPKGRIYGYLNNLMANQVINRSPKRPFTYSIPDLKTNIAWFTKNRVDTLIQAQTELIEHLGQSSATNVELIKDSAGFSQKHMDMINESKLMKIMSIHNSFPYLLYPEKLEHFLKVRKLIVNSRPTITHRGKETALYIYRTYLDALKKGKGIVFIFEKESFDFHMALFKRKLGPLFKTLLQDVIHRLETNHASAYIIDEYLPLQIDSNDKRVTLSLHYGGATTGIMLRNKEAAQFFNKVFKQRIERSQNVLPILKNMLKKA